MQAQRIIQPSSHPYPYSFSLVWNCNADMRSSAPGSSACSRGNNSYTGYDTAAVRSRPGRTPIPDAISCFGSSFLPFRRILTGSVYLWLFVALLPGSFQPVPDRWAFQVPGVSRNRKGTGAVAHDKETSVIGMMVDTVAQGLHLLLAQRG